MPTFLYSVLSQPDEEALELKPCPAHAITEKMWRELAAQIACEPASIPYPAATLARRAEAGYAAVAIWQGRIISHVAFVPIACRTGLPGTTVTWAPFLTAADLSGARMPSADVYQFASGWTAPSWRRKRINMALRRLLLAHYMQNACLGVGGMAGLAQPLLAKLGWQILGWSAAPFVSSLVAIPARGFEDCAAVAWRPPPGMAPYEGPPISVEDRTHSWSQFCYFWVSDPALARDVDSQLAALCGGDICRWRRAILDVFSQPDTLLSLAWLA